MPQVNPRILTWARETAGLTREEAVRRLGLRDARGVTAIERLAALEAGQEQPTRHTLLTMAKQYRRPLVTFYMAAPPVRGDRGQDFRTLPEGRPVAQNALLDALIRDIRARQRMIRAVLEDEDEAKPLPFVGSMKMSDGVPAVLASIRRALSIGPAELRRASRPGDAFALLRARAEAAGIFVLLVSNLGSHHSAIEVTTFRGFALADDVAPFVVVNDQDSRAAWSFTLLHELAHLWLGLSGVSGDGSEVAVERFCNDVAAEFLLPAREVAENFRLDDPSDVVSLRRRIEEFGRARHLSNSLVAYRLYRLGAIGRESWRGLAEHYREQWHRTRATEQRRDKEREGGPSYYVVRRHRLGPALVELVRRTLASGALTPSKASKVLGVKPANVHALVDRPTASGP